MSPVNRLAALLVAVRRVSAAAVVLLALPTITLAQAPTVWPLPLPRLGQSGGPPLPATEVTIVWRVTGAAPNSAPQLQESAGPLRDDFRVTARRVVAESPVRERDPQLSEDDLVAVGVTAQGTEVGWQILKDPSLLRAETPSATGELQHQVLRPAEATFAVTLPARESAITELRLFKPRWTGAGFALDPIGTVAIPANER